MVRMKAIKEGTPFFSIQSRNGVKRMARMMATTMVLTKPANSRKMIREMPRLAAPIRKRNDREKWDLSFANVH